MGVEPKIGGKTLKIMPKPYFLIDDLEGKTHYFRKHPYVCWISLMIKTAPRAQSSHLPMPVAQEQTMPSVR